MNDKLKTPIKKDDWDDWCGKHLKNSRDRLVKSRGSDPDAGASFDEFCKQLKPLLEEFEPKYKAVIEAVADKKKTDRQKEVGRDLERLRKALQTARERGLFKGHAPDFFMSLLILCCETEYNKTYVKVTRSENATLAGFIADVANLLFKCTGHIFQYNSRVDVLCDTVCECLKLIQEARDSSSVRDIINEYVMVRAQQGEVIPGLRSFSWETLHRSKCTPNKLPDDYVFVRAEATHHAMKTKFVRKGGCRNSFLAGHFLLDSYPFIDHWTPEELLHPDISLWMRHLVLECLRVRNERARIVCEVFGRLVEKPPAEIDHESPCCTELVDMFSERGECCSPDDMLSLLRGSLRFVCAEDESDKMSVSGRYEFKNHHHDSLELSCDPEKIIMIEPHLIDYISEERPLSLPCEICRIHPDID